MENYALELLQNVLNEELRRLTTANEITRGNGFRFNSATMKAFDTSKELAEKRIPDLQDAIDKLSFKK